MKFYKHTLDDFKDNFFNSLVEVTCVHSSEVKLFTITVRGTGEYSLYFCTKSEWLMENIIFRLLNMPDDGINILRLKGMGFSERIEEED